MIREDIDRNNSLVNRIPVAGIITKPRFKMDRGSHGKGVQFMLCPIYEMMDIRTARNIRKITKAIRDGDDICGITIPRDPLECLLLLAGLVKSNPVDFPNTDA